jgi:hypothetical protein
MQIIYNNANSFVIFSQKKLSWTRFYLNKSFLQTQSPKIFSKLPSKSNQIHYWTPQPLGYQIANGCIATRQTTYTPSLQCEFICYILRTHIFSSRQVKHDLLIDKSFFRDTWGSAHNYQATLCICIPLISVGVASACFRKLKLSDVFISFYDRSQGCQICLHTIYQKCC